MFSVITPLALGWIAGTALQLQQAQLWAGEVYWGLGAAAVVSAFAVVRISRVLAGSWVQVAVRFAWMGVLSAVLAFVQAGARASHYTQSALNPALEGRTLHVVGIVANLPQRMEDSARFRFAVESARDSDGALVQLPPQLLLGWYGNRLNGSDITDCP